MKKMFLLIFAAAAIAGCSSPQNIILEDGRIIETKDDPSFNKKTNYFEYVDSEGKKGSVNADRVKLIQPVDAKIPEPVMEPEGAETVEEAVGETPAESVEESGESGEDTAEQQQ